jgi:hypothetical protein
VALGIGQEGMYGAVRALLGLCPTCAATLLAALEELSPEELMLLVTDAAQALQRELAGGAWSPLSAAAAAAWGLDPHGGAAAADAHVAAHVSVAGSCAGPGGRHPEPGAHVAQPEEDALADTAACPRCL